MEQVVTATSGVTVDLPPPGSLTSEVPGGDRGGTTADRPTPEDGDHGPTRGDRARQPRYLGGYEVLEEIARGAWGSCTGRARSSSIVGGPEGHPLRRHASASDIRRFADEAESIAQLDHPHIVPIYEVGQ